MRAITYLASLSLIAVMAGGAQAGPIADNAAKAEQLLQSGDPVAAAQALDDAMEELWIQSPLVFRKVLFVEDSSGFGIYRPRESNVFKPGEPLIIYAEPIGYGYGKHALGGNEIKLSADFELTDPEGNSLFSQADFLTLDLPVRYHNREFQMKMTVSLTGLGVGQYKAKFVVHDANSPKTGAFELPFEVAE